MFYNLRINTDFNKKNNGVLSVEPFGEIKLQSDTVNTHAVTSGGFVLAIASRKVDAQRLVAIAENTSFEETLVHITMQITHSINSDGSFPSERLRLAQISGGLVAVVTECRILARKFEYEHRDEKWDDNDYYEAIDKFLNENL